MTHDDDVFRIVQNIKCNSRDITLIPAPRRSPPQEHVLNKLFYFQNYYVVFVVFRVYFYYYCYIVLYGCISYVRYANLKASVVLCYLPQCIHN